MTNGTNALFVGSGSAGHFVLNGNAYATRGVGVTITNSGATAVINGDARGADTGTTTAPGLLNNSTGGAVVTLNGNAYGGTGGAGAITTGNHGVRISSFGTVIINGDAIPVQVNTAGFNCGVAIDSVGTLILNGTAHPSLNSTVACHGVYLALLGRVTIQKVKGSPYPLQGFLQITYGLYSVSAWVIAQVGELEYNGGWMPHYGRIAMDPSLVNRFIAQTPAGNNITLIEGTEDFPAITDVRSGVEYADGVMMGTLAVPPAGSVAIGVPVDGTTGTAVLTQQDVIDAVGPLIAAFGV
jgi:hypothetical protein